MLRNFFICKRTTLLLGSRDSRGPLRGPCELLLTFGFLRVRVHMFVRDFLVNDWFAERTATKHKKPFDTGASLPGGFSNGSDRKGVSIWNVFGGPSKGVRLVLRSRTVLFDNSLVPCRVASDANNKTTAPARRNSLSTQPVTSERSPSEKSLTPLHRPARRGRTLPHPITKTVNPPMRKNIGASRRRGQVHVFGQRHRQVAASRWHFISGHHNQSRRDGPMTAQGEALGDGPVRTTKPQRGDPNTHPENGERHRYAAGVRLGPPRWGLSARLPPANPGLRPGLS